MTTEIHIHDLARKYLSDHPSRRPSASVRSRAIYEFCDWLAENYNQKSPLLVCKNCGKPKNEHSGVAGFCKNLPSLYEPEMQP
jgi:hypothetical protein